MENNEERKPCFRISTNAPFSISRRLSSASRMIPVAKKHHQTQSYSSDANEVNVIQQHSISAPVNVPDWPKIYGKNPSWEKSDDVVHEEYLDDDDDDDDDDGSRVPPHEWLARKLERSQISSFSVCEGAGRTLKGRDLSRVRHAVLSKTGFI